MADTTLIRGAYRANQPKGVPQAKFATDIAKTASSALNQYMMLEAEKTYKANQNFLNTIKQADLNPQNSNEVIEATRAQQQAYIDAKDPIEKQKILNSISSMAEDFGFMEESFSNFKEKEGDISNSFMNSQEGQDFSNAISDPSNIKVVDGVVGVEINGEFMDRSDFDSYLNGKMMDNSFSAVMKALEFDERENRKDLGNDYSFDIDDIRFRVRKDITESSNIRSLFEDTLYSNRNFKVDLIESLSNLTYYDLGITDEMLENSNVNVDDGVDQNEINNLVSNLKSNEPVLRDMLTEYYTDILAQQFGAGKTPTPVVSNISPSGSSSEQNDFDNDGVFVPENNVKQGDKKVNTQSKEVKDRIRALRSNIKRKNIDESKISDEDIQAYFDRMKGRLNTEIFNSANFTQWLRDNNKDIPLR